MAIAIESMWFSNDNIDDLGIDTFGWVVRDGLKIQFISTSKDACEKFVEDNKPPSTLVTIPGQMWATYRDGKIEKMVFTPSGSDAGYFGPSAVIFDGPDIVELDKTDGPFWRAVQAWDWADEAGSLIGWEE